MAADGIVSTTHSGEHFYATAGIVRIEQHSIECFQLLAGGQESIVIGVDRARQWFVKRGCPAAKADQLLREAKQFFFLGLAIGMDGRPPESWLIPLLGELANRHPMSSLEPIREEFADACKAARLKLAGMLS